MKAVTNTSPLIFLTKINRLDFLNEYSIVIPEQVLEEINAWQRIDNEGYLKLKNWISRNRIATKKVEILNDLPNNMGKGEKAAVSLAVKEGIKILLADEKKTRTIARLLGITPVGTIAVIHQQILDQKITGDECRNLVFELIKNGYRIKEELLAEFLQKMEKK